MKFLIIIVSLFLTENSFGYDCPESTNLDDASARHKCLNKVLTHWQEQIQKRVIKKWQKAYSNGGGLAKAGSWKVWANPEVERHLRGFK